MLTQLYFYCRMMSSFHFHIYGFRHWHGFISWFHVHWWENEQGLEAVGQAKVLLYFLIRLQKIRWNTTSITYRRRYKCSKCSSHLQRGISQCLILTRAKLCNFQNFYNISIWMKMKDHGEVMIIWMLRKILETRMENIFHYALKLNWTWIATPRLLFYSNC